MSKPDLLQVGVFPDWEEAPLRAEFTVHRYFEQADKPQFLAEVGPRIRGMATRGDLGADATLIAACPRLEVIAVNGVGYDAVDLQSCRARGIKLTNTPDVLTDDVADLAIALMLAQARAVVGGEAFVRRGDWQAKGGWPLQRRVSGKRAGILGLGRIGLAIAKRLAAFDMDIAYFGTAAKAVAWPFIADPVALAARSDFLFVSLISNAATRHIVNREVLAALGPQGMLINIARGANVDEEALLTALESGALGSAALDVFDNEPAINLRFLALDNVLLQPHVGSATVETRKAMGQLMRDNLSAYFAGRPLLTPVL